MQEQVLHLRSLESGVVQVLYYRYQFKIPGYEPVSNKGIREGQAYSRQQLGHSRYAIDWTRYS
jgi:hypothetical protein